MRLRDIGVVTTGRRGGAARRDERGEADDDGSVDGTGTAEGGQGGASRISVVVGAIACDSANIGVVTTGRRGGAAG